MNLVQGGQGPVRHPFTLVRARVAALCMVSLRWVPVEAGEPTTWTLELGRCHRLPRACLKKACVDGLISSFGEQACSCHSEAAACGAERRGAGGQQAQEEGGGVLLGLLGGVGGAAQPSPGWGWVLRVEGLRESQFLIS